MPYSTLGRDDIALHHLPHLSQPEQFAMVARTWNWSTASIGEVTGHSSKHVDRILTRLRDLVLVPLGLDSKGWAPGLWVAVHIDCCLAQGAQSLSALPNVQAKTS